MPNTYADSVFLNARIKLAAKAQSKFEQRANMTKILQAFLAGKDYIPGLDKIREATTQAAQIMYLKRKAFAIGTAKTCNPIGEVGGSGIVTPTWNTRTFTVKSSIKQHAGNEFDAATALANDLFEAEASFWFGASGIESLALAFLEANRTTVNALSSGATGSKNTWVDAAAYMVDVANANRDEFYSLAETDLMLNNYSGKIFDIHNTAWNSDVKWWSNQGKANSSNTAFQYQSSNFELAPSNLILSSGYWGSVHYLVPEGGVGFVTWNDPLNLSDKPTSEGYWTTIQSQFFPQFHFDVFITDSCADTSGDGGDVQDLVATFEYALNFAFLEQPMSVAGESAIFKYGVRSS